MTQNPLTTVFNAQRSAVEQSQTLTHDALEAQRTSFDAFADALETSGSLVESNAELAKGPPTPTSTPSSRRSRGGRRLRRTPRVRRRKRRFHDRSPDPVDRSCHRHARESEVAYDEFAATYADVVDTSFDTFLEAHEQAEANVTAVAENVEDAADEFDVSA